MTILQSIAGVTASDTMFRAVITIGLLLLYPIGVLVYNVYFHPLSKYPGSKLWAASYLPYIRALLSGTLVQAHARLHRRYGDVIRVGPNEISFATADAWRDIYEYRPGHKEAPKDKTWYIAPNDAPPNIVTTTDTKVRARMRKYLGNSFTEAALKDQQPIIEGYADLFISRIRDMALQAGDSGALVDMTDWINFFTVDVIGDLAFGEPFGCLDKSEYHPWVRTLFNFLKGMVYAASTRFYPWIASFTEKLIPKSVMDLQRQHTEFANAKINRRLNLQTNRPDFMTPFLKHNPGFKHMSKEEIESTFALIIVAGSETSATVLCGLLNHITANEYADKLARLEETIRGTFAKEQDITIESTKDIPYLDAVISEALRLCNPVPGGLPRVVPPGGDVYAGNFLPEGTRISIRPYILNQSNSNFARASEFHPERWLPDERPSEFANDKLSVSKPFSTGPAGCLGKPLAWAEMRLILARLVWAFDLSVDKDRRLDWTKLKAMMTVEKEPMWVRLRTRGVDKRPVKDHS
ncbi:hypothetical protein HIM_09565 [Hirsutella minnesotensis 3608]|uniref:Isotrichodermin C-15 hydroxylase n=1 Tax=Hirsutella minnesotensis 3608 TaxID=1043627 RepID=A0A0F7ZSA8_9HYPO|nr:hypothetical protein HIM_09565 [Hirsutella minnesotensis 3608]